jgi:hypothetical protein
MSARPDKGGPEARETALGVLSEMIARGGAATFLLPPVEPGEAAFPEPWAATKSGVQLLLRRLAWHARLDIEIVIDDRRVGAPPTERKPVTRAELFEVRGKQAHVALGFVGTDDVVGTLVLHRPGEPDPYRSAEPPVIVVEPDRDHPRGAIAAVYRGLGVLGANAAYQQYTSPGRFNGIYVPHEYDVVTAGALPMSTLTYLLAVQAVVRDTSEPPPGLSQSQRDEVIGFIKTLSADRTVLCERLGIDAHATPEARDAVVAFADAGQVYEEAPRKTAFRWQTHRGGVGFLAGTVLGLGVAFVVSRGVMPLTAFGGATAGHLVGRRWRTPRCSACATVVAINATRCPKCGAALRGDIATLSERLEAEEQLEQQP